MTQQNNYSREYALAAELLAIAGIEINGKRPWDIQIHDSRALKQVLAYGSLGLGESYMEGWWSCDALDMFIYKILLANLEQKVMANLRMALRAVFVRLFNMQSKSRSIRVAEAHYNLDNQLYEYMLGEQMSYTCAYWKDAHTLDQAQYDKHDLICRKLDLKKDDHVLELGCGWGSFAKFAASHYGCKMVSVNIAKEQVNYAKQINKDLPVTIHRCDYRDVSTYNPEGIEFDKVVSIGMCEHVGYKNYQTFMAVANQNLKKHGLFLVHTIGSNRFVTHAEPWTSKYIFPNGVLPSIQGLGAAMEKNFIMEDWHNFGAYYDKTLMAWHNNFVSNWSKLKDRYDDRFYRMWTYYLLSCAGMFRARGAQLWQIILSKGLPHGYNSIR